MAKCAICEKGAHFGNNVSHSHRKTPKMWKSNVKSVRVKTEGGAKRMYVCMYILFKIRQSRKSISSAYTRTRIDRPGFFVSYLTAE